jgi:hypothetical protein
VKRELVEKLATPGLEMARRDRRQIVLKPAARDAKQASGFRHVDGRRHAAARTAHAIVA